MLQTHTENTMSQQVHPTMPRMTWAKMKDKRLPGKHLN